MPEHRRDENIHITLDLAGLTPLVDLFREVNQKLGAIQATQKELKNMSQTTSQLLDTALAGIGTALDDLSTDITAIAAEVTTLVAGLSTGVGVTQAQVDAANALAARVTALDTSAKAVVAQAPGTSTHVPVDLTDITTNGQARADGTIRNNSTLPGFNSSLPETS